MNENDSVDNDKPAAEGSADIPTPKTYDLSSLPGIAELISGQLSDDEIKNQIRTYVSVAAKKYKVDQYTILYLYDEHRSISSYHANQLYQAISGSKQKADIFLLINSGGGRVEPAYLISKALKKLAKDKFVVAVPRRAKSAATLLAFGADEIHMGLMSELGPIDPQIGGYPALALSNSLKELGKIVCDQPGASDMLAKYLSGKLDLQDLGFFKRVTESAEQYAERLLQNKKLPDGQTPKTIAQHFVNYYKDHGFVIDIEEARDLLGKTFIREGTPEFECADEVYTLFSRLDLVYDVLRERLFACIGKLPLGVLIRQRPNE